VKCGCGGSRILKISGKTSDCFSMSLGDKEYDGYVPGGLNIGEGGYGDYIIIDLCLDCGKVQGDFPVSQEKVDAAFGGEE